MTVTAQAWLDKQWSQEKDNENNDESRISALGYLSLRTDSGYPA